MSELKSCPFCGGSAEVGHTFSDTMIFIECCECGAASDTEITDIEKAIQAWNTRYSEPRITELENALNEAADDIEHFMEKLNWNDDADKYRAIAKGEYNE